ncbi:MAG TPA: alpha/beta hydrolase, partial [Acidimicrobiales bacterium]|nr:alpha/beta hydrolase [Acidimicrobiales bacterium]
LQCAAVPAPPYDEFGLLRENAEEYGLPWSGPPPVTRVSIEVEPARHASSLVWGTEGHEAELVLLHGGAQNAHTWDTVALALSRPLVAVDLPGHGRSDWRPDHAYSLSSNAGDVARVIDALAPHGRAVVGMSLGGLTAIALSARRPDLVGRLALVDVTPGVDREKAEPVISFVSGPESFASFEEILERTIRFNPGRSEASLRRGVLHNAEERADGRWTWRWDPVRDRSGDVLSGAAGLWEDLGRLEAPLLLVRGSESSVVSDDDVAELLRRRPDAIVEVIEGAGHSVQGDRPIELAHALVRFLGPEGGRVVA